MKQLLLSLVFSGTSFAFAQQSYPQDYFRNPLDIPMLLAGNFGECRPGHFHSGLDIKTKGEENLPVRAAADGYISRIKTEPGGFGHAIYITHPNGYTTLYAHLNDFSPALQAYLRRQQYTRQSWTVDLSFGPADFPVKKGQFIAYSGNTGGSSAPHLHFEIRDSKTEHPLNPMLFGFTIQDNIAPKVSGISIYNGRQSVYTQEPLQVKMKLKDGRYVPEGGKVIFPGDHLLIGIAAHDYMNLSDNTLSFYTAEWYLDDSLMGILRLDDIGYDETRYLNACADYRLHHQYGTWYHNLFILPNNKLHRLYTRMKDLLLTQDSSSIRIVLTDASGNSSTTQLTLFRQPDTLHTACMGQAWKAGQPNTFVQPGIYLSLDAKALYDHVCPTYEKVYQSGAYSAQHKVYDPSVPLHTAFDLSLKPDKAIPFSLINKVVICGDDGKNRFAKAAVKQDDSYAASFRTFGRFWLQADTVAPAIKLLRKTPKEIRVEIKDDLSSVKKCSGTMKDSKQWLCFEQHGNEWFYKTDEHLPKGRHILKLVAEDESGNVSAMLIPVQK